MYKFLILLFLFPLNTYAVDENEIPALVNSLALQLSVNSRIHELEFLDSDFENSIIFKPNIAYIFQADLVYKDQKLVLETNNLSDIGVDDEKGESNYIDIHYSGFFNKDEYSAYYGRYKGFYVSGKRNASGDYFIFDEISTKRYGFKYKAYESEPRMISVDNKYSAKHKELPNKFGTLTYGLSFDVSYINNIPSEPAILSQIENSQFLFFNNLRLITVSPFIGALGRLSTNGYFLEGGIDVGFGPQKQDFELDGVVRSEYDYSLVADVFITAGGVTPLGGIFGIKFGAESVEPTVDENEFSIATIDISLFYRIRF